MTEEGERKANGESAPGRLCIIRRQNDVGRAPKKQ